MRPVDTELQGYIGLGRAGHSQSPIYQLFSDTDYTHLLFFRVTRKCLLNYIITEFHHHECVEMCRNMNYICL